MNQAIPVLCDTCAENLAQLLAHPVVKAEIKRPRAAQQTPDQIEAAVRAFLADYPDASVRDVRAAVRGSNAAVSAAVNCVRAEMPSQEDRMLQLPLPFGTDLVAAATNYS
jgi:hypothetical protein